MDKFTAQVIENAGEELPQTDDTFNSEAWWLERGLDEATLMELAKAYVRRNTDPVTKETVFMLGMMFGFGMGAQSCDPSYMLARELANES